MSNKEKNVEKQNELAVKPIGKLVAKFAIPSVISLTVTALYNIVDQIFIGNKIGYLGNGATNVVFPITALAHGLAMLLGCGCAAYMNLNMGKGKNKEADKGVGNTIVSLILLAVILPLLCEVFISPLLNIFGATTANKLLAIEYGRIIIAGFPFVIMYSGLNQIIRSDGNPKMAMFSMLSGAIINVGLDAWFMYGLEWGIKGAAWATILGQAISFIISLVCIFKLKNVHLTKDCFKMKGSVIGRVCAIGVSSFITQAEIVILTIVMNNVLVKYGTQSAYGEDIPMTAMGIAMKVNSVLTNIIAGIAIGGQPIISFNYGAKKYDRVKKTYKTCVIAAIIVSAVAFLGFQLIPEQISGIFGNEGELYITFACKAFRIYLMFVILVAVVNVSGVFIQSIGKPVKSCILTLVRQVICQCPAIVIFAVLGGVEAALWAGPAADGVAFIIAVVFMIYEFKQIRRMNYEK